MCVMKKIKDKFKLIRKDKSSAAFAVYFFVVILILIFQLLNCKKIDFVTDAFGTKADGEYEFIDGNSIDTEFVVKKDNAVGIVLNGYRDNENEFNKEKLIVKFIDVKTGKVIQKSEILLKNQIDEKDIYVPFEEKIKTGTCLKMSIRSIGIDKTGPVVSVSKTNNAAEYSWLNGELSNKYICASVCYKERTYNWLKPIIYFVAEMFTGIFLFLFQKETSFPLRVNKKRNVDYKFPKIKIRKIILSFILLCGVFIIFFDFVYMKTMEGATRAKDAEIICQESDENLQEIFLEKGSEISQKFVASDDNLSAISIHILNQDSLNGNIIFKIYDANSGELLFDKKTKISKLDELSKHLTKESKKSISRNFEKYCVLEFPEVIEKAKGKTYRCVLEIDSGKAILVGGIGDNSTYERNSKVVNGNICMVALYSNQLFFNTVFRYMIICSITVLLIISVFMVIRRLSIERAFVIAAIFLAFVYSFMIPPYCVPDERAHIDAVYIISNNLLGIEESPAPGRIYKRVSDIDNTKENTMDVSAERYRETFQNMFVKSENEELVLTSADNPVGNVTVFNYLPAAIGFAIARFMHLNTMTMIMFGRWMNALASIFLMWLGIKKIPFGKTTLAVIGLFPIVLQQIASCSYDGILLGTVYVYLAYGFSLMYSSSKSISDLSIMILSGGFSAAACKGGVYIPLLGMFVLMFWELEKPIRKKIKWIIGVAIPLGLVFIAQFAQRILGVFAGNEGNVYSTDTQLYTIAYFKNAPNKLIRLFQNTIVTQGDVHLQQAIGGRLGRLNVIVPWYILIAFLILLLLSGLKRKNENTFVKKGQRFFMLCFSCMSIGLVMLSMLLAFTNIDCNFIAGIQGRYYLPMICLISLSIRNGKIVLVKKNELYFVYAAAVLNVIVFGFALLSILA